MSGRDATPNEINVSRAEHALVKGRLSETTLYLGDNGRAFCGKMKCAGATAYYSGHDLSGQKVEAISAREAHEHGITCEGCGFQPNLVEVVGQRVR